MCTLAVFREVSARYPVVIAANRDEFLERPSRPPARLADPPNVVAGRDLRAGGTWLGCRVEGEFFAAGLLNRRVGARHDGSSGAPVSRGTLCLGVLAERSVADALARLRRERLDRFDPFNLLIVDRNRGVVVDNRDGCHETELAKGLSVLTNLDVNDPRCPRLASAHAGFERVVDVLAAGASATESVAALGAVLGDHRGSAESSGEDVFSKVCVHAGAYGTRSSSIILVTAEGNIEYFHADDAPCRASFERVRTEASPPLRQ